MKAIHNKPGEPEKTEWKFPCLGKSEELIVLFISNRIGVAVSSSPAHYIGEYGEDWEMSVFTPLPSDQSVTLQND
jgi:hypothetical protein